MMGIELDKGSASDLHFLYRYTRLISTVAITIYCSLPCVLQHELWYMQPCVYRTIDL